MNQMPLSCKIPFIGSHGSIVIGSKGSTIIQLMEETGCFIQAYHPSIEYSNTTPYFFVEAPNEKALNQATIRIQRLLLNSMMRKETTIISKLETVEKENQHLNLIIDNEKHNTMDSILSQQQKIQTHTSKCISNISLKLDSELDSDSDSELDEDIINVTMND